MDFDFKAINKYVDNNIEKTFNEMILQYIIERKLDSVLLYKNANLDRRTFSKLYNPKYRPSKNTAICLCISLKLDYDEINHMLQRLGYSLSKSNRYDLIISYFINEKQYNISDINDFLDLNGYEILGVVEKEDKKKIKNKIKQSQNV